MSCCEVVLCCCTPTQSVFFVPIISTINASCIFNTIIIVNNDLSFQMCMTILLTFSTLGSASIFLVSYFDFFNNVVVFVNKGLCVQSK